MVHRRTVSRRQEKKAAKVVELARPMREKRQKRERTEEEEDEDLPEAPQPVVQVEPVESGPKSAFEEFGGVHGLVVVALMLANAHTLTLVLCRQLHCGEYQDLFFATIGMLGCCAGFCSADKSDALGLGGLGRWAMRLQLLLIAVASWEAKDLDCRCLMPYPSSDRLLYTSMRQYGSLISIFGYLHLLVMPRFEAARPTSFP